MSAETKATRQPLFARLSRINVSEHTEKKKDLTYLSWAHAWRIFKTEAPDATYEIGKTEYTPGLGLMCHTKVTAEGESHEMWLPVMDGANKAQQIDSYTYETRYGEKTCEGATMFDINKTIMRCLVKNLAMFGLGINIYAGEDLPAGETPKTDPDATTHELANSPASKPTTPHPATIPKTPAEKAEAWAAKRADQKWFEIVNPLATPEKWKGKPLSDLAADGDLKSLEYIRSFFAKKGSSKTPALNGLLKKIDMAITEAKSNEVPTAIDPAIGATVEYPY